MMVFEIAVGEWDSAHQRMLDELLPVARTTFDALTDAPAALWRLMLAADKEVALPWLAIRKTALQALAGELSHYETLHCLLALAGAGDTVALETWLARHVPTSAEDEILEALAWGFLGYVRRDGELASRALSSAAPHVTRLGGSHAQNLLFAEIARRAEALAV
jgi:hypothetical protein